MLLNQLLHFDYYSSLADHCT